MHTPEPVGGHSKFQPTFHNSWVGFFFKKNSHYDVKGRVRHFLWGEWVGVVLALAPAVLA